MASGLLRMLRAAPHILYHRLRNTSSRDYAGQWQGYWGSVRETGSGGEVLWDSEEDHELQPALQWLDRPDRPAIPVTDLGCGNGRRTAWLGERFERVIGVDVAQAAVDLARQTWSDREGLHFERLDLTDRDAVASFVQRHGETDVFIRGVLHLIAEGDRPVAVDNLARMIGSKGVLYLVETDGTALDYFLTKPGDSPSGLPAGMHRVIQHGILPSGFDADSHQRWFDPERWHTLHAGSAALRTVAFADGQPGAVPAYCAALRLR